VIVMCRRVRREPLVRHFRARMLSVCRCHTAFQTEAADQEDEKALVCDEASYFVDSPRLPGNGAVHPLAERVAGLNPPQPKFEDAFDASERPLLQVTLGKELGGVPASPSPCDTEEPDEVVAASPPRKRKGVNLTPPRALTTLLGGAGLLPLAVPSATNREM